MKELVLVAAGYNASRTVVPLLKSILFYRRNPIVFHFVSGRKLGTATLDVLFEAILHCRYICQ